MTFRWKALSPLLALLMTPVLMTPVLMTACAPPLGRVLVTVVFENESRTQCIKASARNASGASITSNPAALPREGKDSLRIGLGETADLVGEVQVTISRFSSADCSGSAFDSETQSVEVKRGAPTAMLEFRFVGMTDGGVDGGVDAGMDAGVDAGCDVMACGNAPGDCEMPGAVGCNTDGGCRYTFRAPQTVCTGGVCNSMGACIANVCAVLAPGSPCDDGLACTITSSCSGGACVGTCATPPQCNVPVQPIMCDSVTPTSCALRPSGNLSSCNTTGGTGGICLNGSCLPWLQFTPLNFPTGLPDVPYPTGPWTLASTDGGTCDTVISTTGSNATLVQGDCGSPPIQSMVNDAGVSVILATGLDVGPNARLSFVGDKPVQLVVLGSASIRGVVSVAPLVVGQPAGSAPSVCIPPSAGTVNKAGGGGGGFGGTGGNGGEGGASGGGAMAAVAPLRGGCDGAAGFKPSGSNAPGVGGGALQLIVADTLTLDGGIVTASGGGGMGGGPVDGEGAGGGGSGGLLILEAHFINLTNGAVTTNGGGGGEGGANAAAGAPGAIGPISSVNGAPAADGTGGGGIGGTGGDDSGHNGGNGGNGGGGKGGGGGGGSVGVVLIRAAPGGSCTRANAIISGAQPLSINCM